MIVTELEYSPEYRLSRIMKVLENLHGITIDFNAANTENDLKNVYEEYDLLKTNIINESVSDNWYKNADYNKACLIQEAIRIYLKEIAPKRMNRQLKRKQA